MMGTEQRAREIASNLNRILLERYPDGITWTKGHLNDIRSISASLLIDFEREVRLDEAESWNEVLKVQDLRVCDTQWAKQRITALSAKGDNEDDQ